MHDRAGIVVGAAGTLLTQLMAKAMNRPISNILFTPMVASGGGEAIEGTMKELSGLDAAAMMRYASKVIIVPGYGMAVAQAQHTVYEITKLLREKGVNVRFGIHPVAGRMPGHMNVLLAEANVPYDEVFELEDINSEFAQADVAYVIGANDVTNPAAEEDKTSPIYGMPVLQVWKAGTVMFIKRSLASGYAGIDNPLFYRDNTMMLLGDAKKVTEKASFIDDLGADSLDNVELVMAFEEEFGCEIPDDAAETILTVGDATKFLEKNAKS